MALDRLGGSEGAPLVLVLAAAGAALWLPAVAALAACALAVAAFGAGLGAPAGPQAFDLRHQTLLLATMGLVSALVAGLVARLREQALAGARMAGRADELQALGEGLRDAEQPLDRAESLRQALSALGSAPAAVLLLRQALPERDDPAAVCILGAVDADQTAGLWLSLREARAFGPGTGRHEEQGAWYLPLRGRSGALGAARLMPPTLRGERDDSAGLRAHAQALCDQMGLAMERALAVRAAAGAREEARAQRLRNTLLTAISHDYRTPLATIVGAASSLQEQAERLTLEQRRRLAARIVHEAEHLGRLTDNALQLARLDAPGLSLQRDWESAEEIVGALLRRLRAREPVHRVKVRLQPGLPLLRCDAMLMLQMLDNLVDNACKHGGGGGGGGGGDDEAAAVEIVVRVIQQEFVIAVRDRGPGVPLAARERIFDVFQRGDAARGRGAGVGLAVCRAIARAHGGELVYRPRGHGGSSFECRLPLVPMPADEPAGEGEGGGAGT